MKNKTIISIFVGTIIIIGGLVWLGRPMANKNNSQVNSNVGPIRSNETNFDFGTISMAKCKVSHEFTVTNTGAEPVLISKLYTSCMCTTASIMNGTEKVGPFGMPGHSGIPSIKVSLAPGASTQVEAIFDPAAHGPAGVGTISRVVILENSAGKPLELGFTGNVIA